MWLELKIASQEGFKHAIVVGGAKSNTHSRRWSWVQVEPAAATMLEDGGVCELSSELGNDTGTSISQRSG